MSSGVTNWPGARAQGDSSESLRLLARATYYSELDFFLEIDNVINDLI